MMSKMGRYGRRQPARNERGVFGLAGKLVELVDWCAASDRRASLFLVALCLGAFLPGFFSIPPVDRDEARFAQISRQMVETGDPTDVRLGAEARHTRPLGLYWLQAGVVAVADAVGVPNARQSIWLYRLPSLAAGIAAVLLTFWAALSFVSRRAAIFAATLLATSAALGVAARLAIPDAMLVAAVAAMMGALGRAYMRAGQDSVGDRPAPAPVTDGRLAAILWGALAAALLIKGAVAPLYVVLPIVALVIADRSMRFMRPTAPIIGVALCLLVVGVWIYLRHFTLADGTSDVDRGLVGRVAPAFPGFGAPPGAYLLMFWGLFWPAAPLAALAVPIIWKARRLRAVRYLLVWILPAWLLFEMLPTKLPAYVIPTFPAIAILVALAVERGAMALANMRLARLLWFWPLIGLVIAVAALLGLAVFDRTTSLLAWPFLLAGFFALVTAAVSVREYGIEKATLLGIAGRLISGFGVMQLVLPQMDSIWIAPRMAEIAAQERCVVAGQSLVVGAAGYNEPSLMFLAPGQTRFMDGSAAADFLSEGGCKAVFVERRQEARFVRRAEQLGLRIERGGDVRGFDYNNGRRVRISLYRKS